MVGIPEWKKWTLGKLASHTKTSIQTGPFGTVLSASEFVEYGIPVISVREIREGYIHVVEGTPCVTEEIYSRLARYALLENDIVFARKGGVERSAVIPSGGKRFFLGSDGIRVRFDQNVICPRLLLYIFQSYEAKQFLLQNAYGTTMAGLNERILCTLEFFLPIDINEQKRIAGYLNDIDSLIMSLERLIAKKKAIKQGAMQELLTGKKRLPGFSGQWVLEEMRKYITFQVGFPFRSEHFNSKANGLRIIKNRDLKSDDQVYYTTENYMDEFLVHNGDVLVGMDGEFLPCLWKKGTALLNQRVGRIKSNSNMDILFAYYCLQKPLLELQDGTGATTVKHLSHNDIGRLKVKLPLDTREQTAIAAILSDMDDEVNELEQKLAKYRQIKQGMMQQLLTGKIRLI